MLLIFVVVYPQKPTFEVRLKMGQLQLIVSKPISIVVVVIAIVVVKKSKVQKNLGQILFDPKRIYNQNNLGSKKFWVQKNVAQIKSGKTKFDPKKIWVQYLIK